MSVRSFQQAPSHQAPSSEVPCVKWKSIYFFPMWAPYCAEGEIFQDIRKQPPIYRCVRSHAGYAQIRKSFLLYLITF